MTADLQPGAVAAAVAELLTTTQAFVASLQHAVPPDFLAAWPDPSGPLLPVSTWVPVVDRLRDLRLEGSSTADLAQALRRAAGSLCWQRTYRSAQVDAAFMENYGWAEIIGLTGPLRSNRLACGFLLLGPDTLYPHHQHEAREIYIPLSGTALWQRGTEPWKQMVPGSIVFHESELPHAMCTGADPLLALYLWCSDRLEQKSQLTGRSR